MLLATSSTVAGKRVAKTLGLVQGTSVRAHHVGQDILSYFRNMVGGELDEYTKMLAEAREQAIDRMRNDAAKLGANAILDIRFGTSDIATGAAEMLVYGTAVVLDDE